MLAGREARAMGCGDHGYPFLVCGDWSKFPIIRGPIFGFPL